MLVTNRKQVKHRVLARNFCFNLLIPSTPGPSCSKHHQLNKLVKRSACELFLDLKYTDIFVEKKVGETENTSINQILTFKILTKHLLMTSLVLNNCTQIGISTSVPLCIEVLVEVFFI